MTKISVCAIQQKSSPHIKENLENSIAAIEQAHAQGAQLILLQELHLTPYFCQTENTDNYVLAESIPGPTTEILEALAKKLKIVLVASLFEKRAVGIYHNTAVVFNEKHGIAGIYRKMHIPDDPGFYEKFYFTPGDLGFKPIKTSLGMLGVLICWDQWYPEAARLMTLGGADLLLFPTAIGWGTQETDEKEKARQLEAWQIVQRSHAIANGLSVIVANRTGFESATPGSKQGINFWGHSFICGPQGEMIAEAPEAMPKIIVTEIDLKRHEKVRHGWPFLRDRRIEDYQDITERFLDI